MKDLDFIDSHFDDVDLISKLQERALRMKVDILMEEPCPIYEGDSDDWANFWGEDNG